MYFTVFIFLVGYSLITLEHKIRIDKAATALLLGILLWLSVLFEAKEKEVILQDLAVHFEGIAEILFFLLGAMTIVELIDIHDGFGIVKRKIRTTNKTALLWMLSLITFFLSAVLDNLTTTIVMIAILKKFLRAKEDIWFFAGFIVIAANAGGAWSPIGDVTTIMLWNAGQVTTGAIITDVFVPSVACLIIPLLLVTRRRKSGSVREMESNEVSAVIPVGERNFVLVLGVLPLLMVPVFKGLTNFPPFFGMLFGLGVLWLVTDLLHRKKPVELKMNFSVAATLQRIDTTSVLFFLGVLLAVAALEVNGPLSVFGRVLDTAFRDFHTTSALLGLASAIIDNVPRVAGAMGMYPLTTFPQDHEFRTFMAYCVGTGGSSLIIGSAA